MYAQSPGAPPAPPGATFVASAAGGVYYAVGDQAWHHVPVHQRRWFSDEQSAKKAGYDRALPLQAGLEDFDIIGEIGRGATAVVYRARDRALERDVAIKIVRRSDQDSGETLARCAREARVVARLQHPGVVSVYSVRSLPAGGLALIMEYIPGRTLRAIISEEAPLPVGRVERVLRDVGEALAAAHREGIVHRDVKPQNIFVHEATGRSLLADFGIAIPLSDSARITHAGAVIGTPAYMSPEQFDEMALDGRSDLYSLALVGWELLSGHSPWNGNSLFNIIYQQRTTPVPAIRDVRRGVPLRIRIAIDTALQKNPDRRWKSVDEFLACIAGDLPLGWRRLLAVTRFRRRLHPAPSVVPPEQGGIAVDAPTMLYRPDASPSAPPRRQLHTHSARSWHNGRLRIAALAVLTVAVATAAGVGLRMQVNAATPDRDVEHRIGGVGAAPVDGRPRRSFLQDQVVGAESPDLASGSAVLPGDTTAAGARLAAPVSESSSLTDSAVSQAAGSVDGAAAATLAASPEEADTGLIAVATDPANLVVMPPLPVDRSRFTMAVGGLHSCAIDPSGRLFCWGGNERGQLGSSGSARSALPFGLDVAAGARSIVAGGFHTCLLDTEGIAYCWGENGEGQLGGGGIGLASGPLRVRDLAFFSLALGFSHSCGIARDQRAYCWGSNTNGQLGDGSSVARGRPVAVRTREALVSLAAGWTHSCGLTADGRALCWGQNSRGQLGDGTTASKSAPTPVAGGLRFQALTAGSAHTCALTRDGEVYCWGQNSDGRLGDGSTSDRSTPAHVSANPSLVQLSAGGRHTCGLTADGRAFCWGQNGYGQLGTGGSSGHTTPSPVAGDLRFASIRSGGSHTCGVTTSDVRYCWGFNIEGQLGDGTLTHRARPARVEALASAPLQ